MSCKPATRLPSVAVPPVQAACVEAMQTLRIYFVETLHSNVTSASAGKGGAASKLLAFVQARYKEYCDALLAQLQRDRSTRVQLAATVAVLEACRSGAGLQHGATLPKACMLASRAVAEPTVLCACCGEHALFAGSPCSAHEPYNRACRGDGHLQPPAVRQAPRQHAAEPPRRARGVGSARQQVWGICGCPLLSAKVDCGQERKAGRIIREPERCGALCDTLQALTSLRYRARIAASTILPPRHDPARTPETAAMVTLSGHIM